MVQPVLSLAGVLSVLNYPAFDPDIVHFGQFHIRWYGVAYMAGFVLGYLVLRRLVRIGRMRMSDDALADLIAWLVVGVMVGGRGGWWTFYHRPPLPPAPPEPWWEPIAVWHGGMSFHGGFIGVVAVLVLFCYRRRLPFLNAADCLALVTPIGLCLGRLANFINQELCGRVSYVPWAMKFPVFARYENPVLPRHPSQLYESFLEGPVLLACLWLIDRKARPRDGRTAAMFIILYSLIRFAVEFTREPDSQLGFIAFGWLTMGQLLSAAFAVAGAIWLLKIIRRPQIDTGMNPRPAAAPDARQPPGRSPSSKKPRRGPAGRG
jgi:phosphatidylglycerol:prolipoprotein diacylglycerol transferase